MARYVITGSCTIAGSGYAQPDRPLRLGDVVELSAPELSAVTGAGGSARATTTHDALGEGAAVSN